MMYNRGRGKSTVKGEKEMKIGTVNGKKVNWSKKNHTVTVYGENIMMVGADSKEKALDMCKRNLLNFKNAE